MPYKNPEDKKRADARSYVKNRDAVLERSRLRYIDHPERERARLRRYYEDNRDALLVKASKKGKLQRAVFRAAKELGLLDELTAAL